MKASNRSMKPTPKAFASRLAPLRSKIQVICHDTLDFISVPGFPSAIRVFALTHSRRNVFNASRGLSLFR